jgi:hypothetical protein
MTEFTIMKKAIPKEWVDIMKPIGFVNFSWRSNS